MTGAAALLQPLLDLAREPATREAARSYFTSPTVTVNLIPAILVLGALAAALPLLGLPFLPQLAGLLGLGGVRLSRFSLARRSCDTGDSL